MQNFSQQCLDLARAILGQSLPAITDDGEIRPVEGELLVQTDATYAALALGEYYRITREPHLGDFALIPLAARCFQSQLRGESLPDVDLNFLALALFCFGPTPSKNPLWQQLEPEVQERFRKRLLQRHDTQAACSLARALVGFSMGFTKKDETTRILTSFLERVRENTSGGFLDHAPEAGIGGSYDLIGLWTLNFLQQVLQRHINGEVSQNLLPSLRTQMAGYLRLLPDLIRQDGLAWAYGPTMGFYSQLLVLHAVLSALSAGWIAPEQQGLYVGLLRRLFHCLFSHYIDQGHGTMVIRDGERNAAPAFSTRKANFDAVRAFCQWAELAKKVQWPMAGAEPEEKTGGRFIQFVQTPKKEQGIFVYRSAGQRAHYTLPLLSGQGKGLSESLAFPHCPGIFDAPAEGYLPILQPELTLDGQSFIPSFYGRNCGSGMGLKRSFFFRYEQPELISNREIIVPGLASCRVTWTFFEDRIVSEFLYTAPHRLKVEQLRYVIALSAPHSSHTSSGLRLGAESLRAVVEKDDFGMSWQELVTVRGDPQYRTAYGPLHFLQILSRPNPLFLLPGKPYHLKVSFQPDILVS
jgi:hypothetical protein